MLAHFIGQALLWLTRDIGGGYGWGTLLFKEGFVSDGTVAMTTAMSLFMMPAREIEVAATAIDEEVVKITGSRASDGSNETIYEEGSEEGSSVELQTLRGAEPKPEGTTKRPLFALEPTRCLSSRAVKSVDWGVVQTAAILVTIGFPPETLTAILCAQVLLLGGGFALADAVVESGLSNYLGEHVMAPLAELPLGVVTVAVCAAMTIMTEFTSNVATVSVALPLLAAGEAYPGNSRLLVVVPGGYIF